MRQSQNISDVQSLNPNFMGFIFYEASKRYALPYINQTQILQFPEHIQKVAVFVNETLQNIEAICTKYQFKWIQLHGTESPEFCQILFQKGYSIIKAFSIDQNFDFSKLMAYQSYVKYFLFDTPTPTHGGSGHIFDWSTVQQYKGTTPFLLAGGIGPDNFSEALTLPHPMFAGLDLNSKFEIEPGLKNISLLKNTFINNNIKQ